MSEILTFDGHEYRDEDGNIFDGEGRWLGSVMMDLAQEYWIIETTGDLDGWSIHVNEPDARKDAILALIASHY